MTPDQFVAKWQSHKLSERAAYQMHFNELCELARAQKPGDLGADDENYCFEKRAARAGKRAKGWADVWKRDCFAWEYKGAHKNLDDAYAQLLRYHDDLGNVPVLVVCDLQTIVVRVKRTNRATVVRTMSLESLAAFESPNLAYLKRAFHDPLGLESGEDIELITQQVAATLGEVADSLKKRYPGEDERIARFLDRIVFGFFAEDAQLLPKHLLERVFEGGKTDAARASRQLSTLFEAMRTGGDFGTESIRHFNGSLFDALGEPLSLSHVECAILFGASRKNWAEIDPSIFGTLFERSLDDDKRAQLGAHYTSRADIETLVEPVILAPLRAEWEAQLALLEQGDKSAARATLEAWFERLGGVRVLDPACGSGAFLYVALERLLDLEKRARLWSEDNLDCKVEGSIRPEHFLGLEINTYAHDLAQITVWIGFLQWQRANGYPFPADPILRHTDNIQHCDALLDTFHGLSSAQERKWPDAEFIIGNPPFLGGKLLRRKLTNEYVDDIFHLFKGRVAAESDLCCYWFEKARAQIESGRSRRAGLVATQAIRGGANREVLKQIKQSGDIFFAVPDRDWEQGRVAEAKKNKTLLQKGEKKSKVAAVHVSLVGFDDGTQTTREIEGVAVKEINANLTGGLDVTKAVSLPENGDICFMGDTKGGLFDVSLAQTRAWLNEPNPNLQPNSDVLVPWANGLDMTRRPQEMWIIDYGSEMTLEDAELYEKPFACLSENVRPKREKNSRDSYKESWWRHVETRPAMLAALRELPRFIITVAVSKHRLFRWMQSPTLPDHSLLVFARADDYFFGVLHSRVHELWARATGTQVREAESGFRYTPTTCFDPFPFPDQSRPDFSSHHDAISRAAALLNERRENYLNPPDWMRSETLEFRASLSGPWGHLVQNPDERGVGTATWTRQVLKPELHIGPMFKKERTLTHLYNTRPNWLNTLHQALDAAVLAAYDLPADAPDDSILAHLLELNRTRGGA